MKKDNSVVSNQGIEYRQDIDGLRALAVSLVLLYHFDVKVLSGGFIGVDIFFVISGYLITQLISKELSNNNFSFKRFWIRRIRRLLPASLVMMLTVFVVFALVFPNTLFQEVGKSIIAQLLFSSNLYFWSGTGYFALDSGLKPLLHTWSLSVEEQFYLVFPFYLFIFQRLANRKLLQLTVVLTLGSLALAILLYKYRPSGTFFWLPTRSWELGVGACLAMTKDRFRPMNNKVATFAVAAGLLFLGYAALTYTSETPFPSYYATLPVFGTALIIWGNGNRDNIFHASFSIKPLVFIGLISYSLYLWHWPAKVLLNWLSIPLDNLAVLTLALFTTICVATLSYYLVEQPFRTARNSRLVTKSC